MVKSTLIRYWFQEHYYECEIESDIVFKSTIMNVELNQILVSRALL